jgi:hypothetical protein
MIPASASGISGHPADLVDFEGRVRAVEQETMLVQKISTQ